MGKTARRTWQQAEARVAAFFGCRRKILSGSCGRDDETAADCTHPALFIEAKLRTVHTARTLFDVTKKLAVREKKVPILSLFDKNRPGFLIVVHSDDWAAVVEQYRKGDDNPRSLG